MTQKERLLQMFRENNNQLTLGQILKSDLAAEYRARISNLRGEGYRIECTKNKKPSLNTYTLIPEPKIITDPNGQGVFL